jgi:hypothetical protein
MVEVVFHRKLESMPVGGVSVNNTQRKVEEENCE